MHSSKNEQTMTASNSTGESDIPQAKKEARHREGSTVWLHLFKAQPDKLMYESNFMFSHSYAAVPTPLLNAIFADVKSG